ncbi:response regulator [Methylomonas sp. SURF-2]|uniref:Response regulator n=1 Tax=Methylomonas subterranea TaxID=2952225 RepID=A0ABT1TIN7_9GAMM|nr:hybrid sensor histidine kinase/response regulator [Methylomonas sp. SURF-2]MCQ8105328.1 response regulator [Methylomonas sp. SURF-2]
MISNDLSILVADDNEMNRWLLAEQLRCWSENITLAVDGREAWGFLQGQKYALVFLDVNMPGLTGFELVKKVREDSVNQTSPVIAITAHVQSHQKHLLTESGFNDCLIKPIVLADLQRIIDQWRVPAGEGSSHYYANTVLEKFDSNKALGKQFLQKLFQELPLQMTELKLALQAHAAQPALNIAHKLHGSFCFYGLADFRASASRVEQSLIAGEFAEACRHFQQLDEKCEALLDMRVEVLTHMEG